MASPPRPFLRNEGTVRFGVPLARQPGAIRLLALPVLPEGSVGGRNVQVHAKDVRWIVFRLELRQALVVDPVAGLHKCLLLLAEPCEVQVQPSGRVLSHRSPELATPSDRVIGDS